MYYTLMAPTVDDLVDLNTIIECMASDLPQIKIKMQNGMDVVRIPTNKFELTVDKEKVLKNGIVSPQFADQIVSEIPIDVKANALYRMRIIMFDIIANNNWDRPVYFTNGSLTPEDFLWMKDYLQLSGMARSEEHT